MQPPFYFLFLLIFLFIIQLPHTYTISSPTLLTGFFPVFFYFRALVHAGYLCIEICFIFISFHISYKAVREDEETKKKSLTTMCFKVNRADNTICVCASVSFIFAK